MPSLIDRHTRPNKSIRELRSGVLRNGQLKPTNSGPSQLKATKKLNTTYSFSNNMVDLKTSNTTSPPAGRKRKANEVMPEHRPKSKDETILAGIRPERMLRVKRVRPSTLVLYDSHVQQLSMWAQHKERHLSSLANFDGNLF